MEHSGRVLVKFDRVVSADIVPIDEEFPFVELGDAQQYVRQRRLA